MNLKETNFEGFRISGFLAIFIGLLLIGLCVFLIIKDTLDFYGIFVASGLIVMQLLTAMGVSLKVESKDVIKKVKGLNHPAGKPNDEKFSGLSANTVIPLFGLFILFAVSEVNLYNALGVGGFVLLPFFIKGFLKLEPNETAVLVFFGKYRGTFRENGFFWVNPFYTKHKIPTRVRNMAVAPIKVNDKAGNPIMIGAVLTWRIRDTYKATFDIDNKSHNIMAAATSFVNIQSDAALRQVASLYAYDNNDVMAHEVTLRSDSDEIGEKLEQELNSRLDIAGIEVLEARINYLAYASEIAKTMLRRQQAEAIVAAREKVVEGAVSMVEMALERLQKENVVKLDDQRRAVMTCNLLAVLCTDEGVHLS